MPAESEVRPSTTARINVCLSSVRPMAVRGWRSRMSLRSVKQLESVGLAQSTAAPAMTNSGKPLTRASVPDGGVGRNVVGAHPSVAARFSFTHSVCV